MKRLAQIGVLTANHGQTGSQFGVDKAAEQGNEAAGNPGAQDQRRGMHLVSNYVWVYEDPRADDPTHDGHRGTKQAKLPGESAVVCRSFVRVFGNGHESGLWYRAPNCLSRPGGIRAYSSTPDSTRKTEQPDVMHD